MNFSLIDFFIGLTLVNTMPHFVLGLWKGRMLSGLGFGNRSNILYAFLNFSISIGLFVYKYGWNGLSENAMYTGALIVMVLYFLIGPIFYQEFHKKYYNRGKGQPLPKTE